MYLSKFRHFIFLSKRKCLILGDININTLVKITIAKEHLNLVHSEGFNPLIFEANRITETTISCVDHIYSNFVTSSTSGSIAVEIADHLFVFSLSYDPLLSPFPDTIKIRDSIRFDEIAFLDELRSEKLKSVITVVMRMKAYRDFYTFLTGLAINKHQLNQLRLRGEKLNYNSCKNLLLRKSQNLLFLAPEVQWALRVYRVCSIHVFFKCFEPRPYLVRHVTTIENV